MALGYVLHRAAGARGRVVRFPLFPSNKFHDNSLQGSLTMLLAQTRFLSQLRGKHPPNKQIVKLVQNNVSDYPYVISKEMENFITAGDLQAKVKLQGVLLLMAVMREQGQKLPEKLDSQNFLEMIESTEEEVYKLIEMYNVHNRTNTLTAKIQNNRKLLGKHHKTSEGDCYLSYDSFHNSLFSLISKVDQSHYYNTNLIQGLLFGQKIVFDCAFEEYMTTMELKATAKQLNDCIRLNRRSLRPFGLNFCNLESNGKLLRHLKLHNPAIENDLPVNLHSGSYLDLFRREDIVYLSPYVHREFEYHPNDVYVLSALSSNKPLCVKKARKEGVRCFKLPLSFYELQRKSRLRLDEVCVIFTHELAGLLNVCVRDLVPKNKMNCYMFQALRKLLLRKNTGDLGKKV